MSHEAFFPTLQRWSTIGANANASLPLYPSQYDILIYYVKDIFSCRSFLQFTTKEKLTYDFTTSDNLQK
uniref:Uncharacterized protein n=1 Tax=Octopus bimaculoides TaxID=37653 RepID=A0A0L8GAV8_OCTBM